MNYNVDNFPSLRINLKAHSRSDLPSPIRLPLDRTPVLRQSQPALTSMTSLTGSENKLPKLQSHALSSQIKLETEISPIRNKHMRHKTDLDGAMIDSYNGSSPGKDIHQT